MRHSLCVTIKCNWNWLTFKCLQIWLFCKSLWWERDFATHTHKERRKKNIVCDSVLLLKVTSAKEFLSLPKLVLGWHFCSHHLLNKPLCLLEEKGEKYRYYLWAAHNKTWLAIFESAVSFIGQSYWKRNRSVLSKKYYRMLKWKLMKEARKEPFID